MTVVIKPTKSDNKFHQLSESGMVGGTVWGQKITQT